MTPLAPGLFSKSAPMPPRYRGENWNKATEVGVSNDIWPLHSSAPSPKPPLDLLGVCLSRSPLRAMPVVIARSPSVEASTVGVRPRVALDHDNAPVH